MHHRRGYLSLRHTGMVGQRGGVKVKALGREIQFKVAFIHLQAGLTQPGAYLFKHIRRIEWLTNLKNLIRKGFTRVLTRLRIHSLGE